jgi:hypothetical protein
VGVGFHGGEIRLGGGEQFLDVLVKFELVIFDGQQIVPSALQHDVASRLGLGVQSIQRDETVFRVS